MQLPSPPEIRLLSYEEIHAFWATHLWQDNPESLRPLSSMLFDGGYDLEIKSRFQAIYLGLFQNAELLGVNSGHFSAPKDFRSRGLCVRPDCRGRGHGETLLLATIQYAKEAGATRVWSYPRESAWALYEKCGFNRTGRRLRETDSNEYAFLEITA